MESAYEIFAGEIAAKGTAYLVLQHCRAGELEELLSRGRAELLGLGASELYVTSRDPAAPLSEGVWEDFRLEFARDMLWMERELADTPPAVGITLEPLTRERGGAWMTLHNACFFDAPNSSTYGPNDLERAMAEGHRCGFAVVDGVLAGVYELDLTLRNNITTEENPLGVYHPHAQYHHIKKENIGLIEVMGLAVLPARLKEELELLAEYILEGKDPSENEMLEKHSDWVKEFLPKYPEITKENIMDILQEEVGQVFVHVLEDAGVYKCTPEGREAFRRFIKAL